MWCDPTFTFTFVSIIWIVSSRTLFTSTSAASVVDRLSFRRTVCDECDYIRKWRWKKNVSLAHNINTRSPENDVSFLLFFQLFSRPICRYHFRYTFFFFVITHFTYRFSPSMGIGTINSTLHDRLVTHSWSSILAYGNWVLSRSAHIASDIRINA